MVKSIIVPIHGILTDVRKKDDWAERFEAWLWVKYPIEMKSKELVFKQFSYGYLTPFVSWLTTVFNALKWKTWLDKLSVTRFKRFILKVREENPDANIHIIAHSFGTWTTQRVLRAHPSVNVQSVTLLGSAISAHISKNYIDDMIIRKQIKVCFSWSSHNDNVIRFVPPPFGHLGYWGFLTWDVRDRISPKRKPFENLEIFNIHTNRPHTNYFVNSTMEKIMEGIEYANKLGKA